MPISSFLPFAFELIQDSFKNTEPPDPLKIYVQIGAIITAFVGLVVILVTKTWPWLRAKRDQRSIEKNIGAELFPLSSIERSVRYYITPSCQNVDPAVGDEPSAVYSVRQNLFTALDDALNHPTEYRYLIVLADSGMGKTSALLNYYVRHLRRFRKNFELVLVPLGIPDADERITAIPTKTKTVLFLDALDEDTLAIVDHVERIRILLKLTREFARVVITCRTQFFPKDEEIPQDTGILKVGARAAGEKAEYVFHKLYLSPFSDEQVQRYLKRRYSIWRRSRRNRAKEMVRKIPNLTARPMLLAHVDDLVHSDKEINYSFELYAEMVEAWLRREEGFIKEKEHLREFSKLLAVDLFVNRQARGAERVTRSALTNLAKEWNIVLDDWKLGGRSLLNRDAQGNYKFAHRSIMEYLFVERALESDDRCFGIEWTHQMNLFLCEVFRSQLYANISDHLKHGSRLNDWTNLQIKQLGRAFIASKNELENEDVEWAQLNALLGLADMMLKRIRYSHLEQYSLALARPWDLTERWQMLEKLLEELPPSERERTRKVFGFANPFTGQHDMVFKYVSMYPARTSAIDMLIQRGFTDLSSGTLTGALKDRSGRVVGLLAYVKLDKNGFDIRYIALPDEPFLSKIVTNLVDVLKKRNER